jgi:dTMP kinase
VGEKIREHLLASKDHLHPMTELLLFLAARVEHIETVIKPAIKRGEIVLCDRFNDSSVAYQGGGRGLGVDLVENLCKQVTGRIKPDLTFLLDIDPEVGMKRLKHSQDRIESAGLAFHQKVRHAFLDIAKREPERVKVVDAALSQDQVFKHVLSQVPSCK